MRMTRALRRLTRSAGAMLLAGSFFAGIPAHGEGEGESSPLISGHLWGALIRATDQGLDASAKPVEAELQARLEKAFPFHYYQLLGQHTQPVSPEYETWVLPSEELYMKVDSKGPVEGGLGLHLQLWRRQNVILKTDVVLTSGSPIVIAGPKWGADQLLFVVQLREHP